MALERLDIGQLRTTLAERQGRWEAGDTNVSHLAEPDKLRRLGYVPGPEDPPLEERELIARTRAQEAAAVTPKEAGYPPSIDWRNVGGSSYVSAIRDQGFCGSCVAFGTCATVEARARVVAGQPSLAIDLSEAQLFYCIGGSHGRNCGNGWWPDQALEGVRDTGLVDEGCFPYTAGDQTCSLCPGWQQRATTISGWHRITSAADMKTWLAANGPLTTCFTVYNDFFAYRGGVYHHVTGDRAGGHCVSVVGYDDLQGYWICQNSWGAGWGESGFFRIAYGDCGIDATMWAAETVVMPTGRTGALYRYWNSGIGDHFYTTDWNELRGGNYGWAFEGIQCYACTQQQPGTVPLYRYWNSGAGDHFYTTDGNELGTGRYGWSLEGIQCYVLPQQQPGSVPLYRYWNPSIADHFYTTDWNELGSGNHGWSFERIECFVLTSPAGTAAPAEAAFEVPETFRAGASAPLAQPMTFRRLGAASSAGPGITSDRVPGEGTPDSFRASPHAGTQDVPPSFSTLGDG
jgi:hypothetical protein